MKSLSLVRLFATPWTIAFQVPPSMGFSRCEHWSGLLFLSSGDLPDPGIDPGLPHCRQMLYHLSHQGNPVIVKFYIFPFKKVSSIKYYGARFFSFSYFKTIRGCKISFTHKNIMLPGNKTTTIVYWGT